MCVSVHGVRQAAGESDTAVPRSVRSSGRRVFKTIAFIEKSKRYGRRAGNRSKVVGRWVTTSGHFGSTYRRKFGPFDVY